MALNWAVTVIFAAAAIAGTLAGGRLAGRVSPQRLNTAFTVLVIGVAVYTLARSLPPSPEIPRRVYCRAGHGKDIP